MPVRTAQAVWSGGLRDGRGKLSTQSGVLQSGYSFGTRFEAQPGTNPEELIGAAHAGCFSMALAMLLQQAGFTPASIETTAAVHLERDEEGFTIGRIELSTVAEVAGIEASSFEQLAQEAKAGCPVSRALAATPISLRARLAGR